MASRGRVIDRDKGYRALLRRIQKAAAGRAVTVGVHDGEGGNAAEGGGGVNVSDVATIHEFGLGHVPERSWLRAWYDANESENEAVMRRLGEAIVRGSATVDEGLDRAGLFFVASVQARIRGGIEPPLAPATLARKGNKSTPLILTGQFVSSITHRVV